MGIRSYLLPEVPTIAEAGVAGFDYPIWYGVWVPAGTPAAVVDKLAKDIARVLAAPDVHDALAKHGAEPMSMTQPDFARFVLSESKPRRVLSKPLGSNLNKREVPHYEAPHRERPVLRCPVVGSQYAPVPLAPIEGAPHGVSGS